MHKAEHGGIRPDCERDGGNRHSREARAVAKQANGVTKVVNYAGQAVQMRRYVKDWAAFVDFVGRQRGATA